MSLKRYTTQPKAHLKEIGVCGQRGSLDAEQFRLRRDI